MAGNDNGSAHEDGNGKPPKKPPVIVRVLRHFKRRRHKANKRQTEHQKNERMMARWTRRVGVFTIILAAAAIASAVIFYRQQTTMHGQLKEMRAEQRPWVYADVKLGNKISLSKDGNYFFQASFNLHNTGHTPAVSVTINYDVVPMKIGEPFNRVHSQKCDAIKHSSGISTEDNFMIFPGQDTIATSDNVGYPKKKWESDYANKNVLWVLIGCVDYKSPMSNIHHQTAFGYLIGKVLGDAGTVLDADPTDAPMMNYVFPTAESKDAY